MFKGHQNQKLQRSRDRLTTFVRDYQCICALPQPEKTCKQPEPGRTTRVNVFISFSQVRAICVQIAYHSKLEVSSLSGDFKNAHRSSAQKNDNGVKSTIQTDPCDYKGHTHTPPQGEAKIRAGTNVQVCAQQRQKDEDVRRKTRRDKSVCGSDERETKCTGTTDETHLIVETWAT